ncbi:MAG: YybS family protein [Oligoflexia bacterium]|nr:YybS family protein [Oligoflexia bacterium]
MSRWATEPEQVTTPSRETRPASAEPPSRDPGAPRPETLKSPHFWVRLVPFFFSALLFLSAFFAIFAPFPLLITFFQSGRRRFWLTLATNTALVAALGGLSSLVLYLVFGVALSVGLAEALARRSSLEKASLAAFLAVAISGAGALAAYSMQARTSPKAWVTDQVTRSVDYLVKSMPAGTDSTLDPAEQAEELRRNVLLELPSGVAILALMMIWANLLILLRLSPGGIRQSLGLDSAFHQKWKAPEWLVWPTIVSGFFLLVEVRNITPVSLNLFRFLMAIYALQGLSILSAAFEAWNIRGIFRSLGFLLAVFVMMPLLLGLGFFDLWFDFRSKFRQS